MPNAHRERTDAEAGGLEEVLAEWEAPSPVSGPWWAELAHKRDVLEASLWVARGTAG